MLRRKSKKKVDFDRELDAIRPLVLERADWRCEVGIPKVCTNLTLVVHHRKRKSQGGDNSPENLLVLCEPCHAEVHRLPLLSYTRGWLCHSWENPLDVTISSYRKADY